MDDLKWLFTVVLIQMLTFYPLAKEDRFDDPEDQMYFGGKWSPV